MSQEPASLREIGVNRRLLVLVLLTGLFVAGCSKRENEIPVEEAVLPEVSIDRLVRMDGRLHLEGEDVPFTGIMVDLYPDGARKARAHLEAGVLHGPSEGWFSDGQLQTREAFAEGVSHGLRTRFHPNGNKRSEAEIVRGEIHGTFRRWHENGTLAEETEFVRGKPHGRSVAYFEDGKVRARVLLAEGAVVEREFSKDGERQALE